MSNDLLQKLKAWRKNRANLEGIEAFQVFHNTVLEGIAELRPKNKAELMAIKGIRDRKYEKYGEEVLAIINDGVEVDNELQKTEEKEPLSVSSYLDYLNRQLVRYPARIQGEISSVDERERVVYFSLKDSEDESVINCLIWKNSYKLNGIEFEIGMEVILEGVPDIYKPSGRLSFKASTVELVGEGALKKAYGKLKAKLLTEGLFSEERKKPIPDFPQKIGLITSETGAVIHDFLTNLGKFGFQIKFIDSRVEGKSAIPDIISAIDYFYKKDIDALVIIRGGGSLESLQAFNSEALVRKISDFNKPVICGIGHDKDVPLASLAADKAVSTPTATAHVLNRSWQEAASQIQLNSSKMLSIFSREIYNQKTSVQRSFQMMRDQLQTIFDDFNSAEKAFSQSLTSVKSRIYELYRRVKEYPQMLVKSSQRALNGINQSLSYVEQILEKENPERQLRLGYSIARSGGKVIRKVEQVRTGNAIEVTVQDGSFEANVSKIKNDVI